MICVKNIEANNKDSRNVQVKGSEAEILDDLIVILKLFSKRADLRGLWAMALIRSQETEIESFPAESEKRS